MKRREFVQMTALAAGGVLSSQVASATASAAISTNATAGPNSEAMTSGSGGAINPDRRGLGLKKPPVGPKLTVKQLEERTSLTATDGRKHHLDLPGSWDNAEWVSDNPSCDPRPHWPKGHAQNQELKRAIFKAFVETKKIDMTDPDGSPWLLAWRMYPNADHPMWKEQEGHQNCGCNCGCFAPKAWSDT